MSKIDMYKGQADNIVDKIEQKVSDLMITVKKHPSMKKYSPHVRKGVQQEIKAILSNRISNYSLKIDDDDINQWLNEYTPYAQASTTAYIQRVAKEKGYKTLTPEQVEYVRNALSRSMEPNEYFDWSTGTGVKIPRHYRDLGTERDLAAKVDTHVDWAVKKTVGNALKPENVIEFLVKNKKALGIDNIDDIDMRYVDNVISVASMSLREASGSNGKKITKGSIQNIDNALLHAAFTANSKVAYFSGALLRKIGTSTFVNNDTRLGEIKKEFDNKIGAKARTNQDDVPNYSRLKALMNRFFTALRWSMHYKTGKMGTSTYTAENQYMKIELAILEFVANTNLSMAELVRRFESIFASNDNPEAVERLYMTEVLNAWWLNVSRILGIDEDISLEIQSEIIAEKSGEYADYNEAHFERDIATEKEMKAGFKTVINDFLRNGSLDKARENKHEIEKLVKRYVQAKNKAELQKKEEATAKRKERAKLIKEGKVVPKKRVKDKTKNKDKDETEKKAKPKRKLSEEEKAKINKRAKERRDTKKRLQDKLLDAFEASNMQNAKEVGVGNRTIKVLDKTTLNNLKYTLFGTSKELTKGDFSKFLSAAYRVSGANDKGTRDLFIATHASLIKDIFNNEDVFNKDVSPQLEKRFNNAKTSLLNYDKKLSDEKSREDRKVNREKQNEEKAKVNEINTSMSNFIRVSTSNFDADFRKLRNSSNRYLQQTTSRLKLDVVRKIGDSKLNKDLKTYRAAKNERHKAIVNSSVSDFISKANQSLDMWEQEAKAEVGKLYNGREKEKTKALGEIAKLKKSRQATIRDEARKMKNEALEKFHDAVYS